LRRLTRSAAIGLDHVFGLTPTSTLGTHVGDREASTRRPLQGRSERRQGASLTEFYGRRHLEADPPDRGPRRGRRRGRRYPFHRHQPRPRQRPIPLPGPLLRRGQAENQPTSPPTAPRAPRRPPTNSGCFSTRAPAGCCGACAR
jgi:hypothetical protein